MDYINRIELQGRVGTVRTNVVGEAMVAHFSMVTEYLYKTRDGGAANEVTWHNVTAWESREMPDLRSLTKGMAVHVIGRQRTTKYTATDGTERQMNEIAAQKIRILTEDAG